MRLAASPGHAVANFCLYIRRTAVWFAKVLKLILRLLGFRLPGTGLAFLREEVLSLMIAHMLRDI
jgi:hypothetical protein